MKFLNLFLILTLGLILSGCTDKSLSYNVANFQRFIKSKMLGPESINLLEPNLEVPASCKPPLASEQNKIAFIQFRGKVNRCVHIINQTPALNNFNEVKNCINDIGNHFAVVPEQSCKNTVLVPGATGNAPSIMELMLSRFYNAHVLKMENGTTVFKWNELTNYFSLVSVWFQQTRSSMYPLNTKKVISDVQANDFETKINKKIWDDLQAYSPEWRETFGEIVKPISPTNPDGSPRTPEELQALRASKNLNFQVFETMLTVNKKVLDSLFASELASDTTKWNDNVPTLAPSPLLASMFGSALSPFFQRVRIIAKIYDIACKLKTCEDSFYQSNMTYWFLKYFYSIAINQTLATLPFDETEQNKPLPVFLTSINQNRNVIKKMSSALETAFNITNVATLTSGADFPHFLESYRQVFEESYDLIKNYENTRRTLNDGTQLAGFFVSKGVQEINVGFSKTNMDRHINKVKDANERLSILQNTFNQQKHTLIQEVLNINASSIKLKDLSNNINIDVTDIMNKKNEIDAIRNYVHDARTQYSKKIISIMKDETYAGNDKNFISNPSDVFSVQAVATSAGVLPDRIDGTTLKILDTSGTYKKGDVLQITTAGEWSPTCAVSEKYGSSLRYAKTGGRGFSLIESNGQSKVQSTNNYKTKESFAEVSVSVSACAGYGFSAMVKTSAQACVNASAGTRISSGTTNSDTSSSSVSSDASFDLGLALPNTPFDQLAAGSLLFIEMPKGVTLKNKFRRITALSNTNTIVLNHDDSDYYLVGNDCGSSNNSGELTVTVTHSEPQGVKVTQFINKISSMQSEIEDRVKGLIREGQLNYQVLEGIKLELKALGGDTSQFNGQMYNMIESMISFESTILGFKSQLVVMERELEVRKKKLLGLLDQYTAEDEQRTLRVDTRNWLLSNMDLDFVNGPSENLNLYTLDRILNTMEHSLVSYVDFKYRSEEKKFILGDVSLLQKLQFSDSFDQIAKNITNYTRVLLGNLEEDLNNKPVVPKTTVGIRIPNPYYQPTFPIPPSRSLHPVMEESRARDFWLKLKNWKVGDVDKELKLDILIDDLYAKNGLGCFVQAPIIESWGMFFVPENEGYITDFNNNYRHKNAKIFLEGMSTIPYEVEPKNYNFVGSNWRYMDAAVRMAKSANDGLRLLVTEFPPEVDRETGLGTGRPLFGTFKVGDLRPWRSEEGEVYIGETPINEIKEVFVGYVLSASSSDFNVNMNWINYCAQ